MYILYIKSCESELFVRDYSGLSDQVMLKMNSGMFAIEKLDDDNYSAWAIQMKSVLIHTELWPVVCGHLTKSENGSEEQNAQFDAKEEKALASIMLCIKPSQINNVKQCKRALEAWNKLKEIYTPKGPARRINLFKQLLYLKMSANDSIGTHVNSFSDIVEKLQEIELTVPDEILAIILLSSLNDSFENFVVAIESRDVLPSVSALKLKLLEEGERRKACDEYTERSEKKIFAACTDKQSSKSNGSSNTQQRGKSNVTCWSCGRRGHIAANCKVKEKSTKPEEDKSVKKTNFTVLTVATNNELAKEMWCLDSGATAHLCCARSMFIEFYEHKEKIMLAGNNSIVCEFMCVKRVQNVRFAKSNSVKDQRIGLRTFLTWCTLTFVGQ